MRTAADVADQAARAGGLTIAGTETMPGVDGAPVVVTRMTFTDPWAAARLLHERAEDDAGEPIVRDWALRILHAVVLEEGAPPGPQLTPAIADATAAAIMANVQSAIRFVHEKAETFQGAVETIKRGYGDCDDHAELVYALAASIGIPAALCFFDKDGEPVHVVARLLTSNGWQWAETTIPADFGEHPLDAYARVAADLEDGRNPFMQPPGPGALERVSAIGFLGLEFVTPQDVRDYKGELDTHVTALDADVVACVKADPTGAKLDTATLDAWNQFVAEWRTFMADDPGFFSAGAQGRLANNYAHTIAAWEERITAAGCTLSAPRVVLPPDDPVVGTIKTVAIAGAVVAGAFALWELAQYIPKPRRRAA